MNDVDAGNADPKPLSIVLPSSSKFSLFMDEEEEEDVEVEVEAEGGTAESGAADERSLELASE